MEKIRPIMFDTTLRDGHQCPGAAIVRDQDYFEIVRGIDGIGFDIMEVGFPSSSPQEFFRVNEVAKMAQNGEVSSIVAGLCQAVEFQVEKTIEALAPATQVKKGFLHTYYPVDPRLRQASVGQKTKAQAIKDVGKFIKMASDSGLIVQFSPEGYSRVADDFDFCTDLIVTAIENGASYINCPDTIGGEDRDSGIKEYYIETMNRHKAIIDKALPGNSVIWSVHNHNDIGTAVQNSFEGVLRGPARKIEGTINGIGERAGNADLGQVIIRMKTTLSHLFDIDHIDVSQLSSVGDLVSQHMLPTQPHYPITGANAAKHTSGGHTNAVLKDPMTYQPYDPALIGKKIELVFGPNSGGNLAQDKIRSSGYICDDIEKREIAQYIKEECAARGRYKGVTDKEFMEIYFQYRSPVKIEDYSVIKNDDGTCQASFTGNIFGIIDPVVTGETVFQALKVMINEHISGYSVEDFTSHSAGEGSSSSAISEVKIKSDDSEIIGKGEDKDIEVSSIKALCDAYNRVYIEKRYKI